MRDEARVDGSAAPSRRTFLRTSSALLAASSLPALARGLPAHVAARATLRVGLVGCGGRGTGAAVNALMADPHTELVALGDLFADHLESSLATLLAQPEVAARVKVDAHHRFVGFDAFRGVIDSCDVVLLCETPHFRATHMEYALEKGRHMFVEKPIAADGPSLRRVRAAGKAAVAKGFSVVSGLCYRYQRAKQETIARIREGAVGDVVALQCSYNGNGLWLRPRQDGWSELEYQLRNWIYFAWASGDHIAEQHIHSLDKLAWAMGDVYPVKATSSGGRVQRTEATYGNVYDHFNTVYEWESGIRGFSSCRQWNGAATDVSDFVFGTKGRCNIQEHVIRGETKWRHRAAEGDVDDMYLNEHVALFTAIRAGNVIDDVDHMCDSTRMALMGRLAAYTGQVITAEQAENSQEALGPEVYDFASAAPLATIAVPGVTRYA
jgi:predicted dehydrogenase